MGRGSGAAVLRMPRLGPHWALFPLLHSLEISLVLALAVQRVPPFRKDILLRRWESVSYVHLLYTFPTLPSTIATSALAGCSPRGRGGLGIALSVLARCYWVCGVYGVCG
jgi:hypothetical protein